MTIAQKITKILIKKDWSQEQLAGEMKVSPSQISRWISGTFQPRHKNLAKLDELFNNLPEED